MAMTPERRLRNRISNYLFLATIFLSVIVPVMFLHHHRLAAILAIWSLLWFGFLVHLSIGRPRVARALGDDGHRRAITNAAITVVFLALFAVAAFYGERGVEIAASACGIYLVGYMLYRFAKTREQLKPMDWLLAAVFVGLVAHCAYLAARGHVAACSFPFGLAILFWTILITRRRVLLPDLNGFPQEMRDLQTRLVALENDGPDSSHTGPA